jgi:hypothetical protein
MDEIASKNVKWEDFNLQNTSDTKTASIEHVGNLRPVTCRMWSRDKFKEILLRLPEWFWFLCRYMCEVFSTGKQSRPLNHRAFCDKPDV